MVTGITLMYGPYDGYIANIETPLPFVLIIDGDVYYQDDENESLYKQVEKQRTIKASSLAQPVTTPE